MRKWSLVAGMGALALAGVTQTVFAGTKWNNQVVINTSTRTASGSLGAARASADGNQLLACWVNTDGGSSWGECLARNSGGTLVRCSTSNSHMIESMRALNSDANLSFYYNASGACTMLTISNYSADAAKTP